MTIAMLSLAGFPATAGFIGKFYLIDASVAGDYTWLGIVIVIGSVRLARLLPARGRGDVDGPRTRSSCRPSRRGGSGRCRAGRPRPTLRAQPEVAAIAIMFAAATILFGIWPDPLFDAARDMGTSISALR